MSSPREGNGPEENNPRKGLTKFIRRASRALRPRSTASTGVTPSESSTPATGLTTNITTAVAPTPIPATEIAVASTPVPAATVTSAIPSDSPAPSRFSSISVQRAGVPRVVTIPRPEVRDSRAHSQNQQEKAQLLFAKYGLSLSADDWTPTSRSGAAKVEWVEKKVRVRVHRQCHNCGTSFGSTKDCANCSHVRCKKCPRFPPKAGAAAAPAPSEGAAVIEKELASAVPVAESKDVDMTESSVVAPPAQNLVAPVPPPVYLQIDQLDHSEEAARRMVTNIHTRRGADTIYRPPVHRVRRFCHKCEAQFRGRSTNCESCGHQRCPNCPREPHKPNKYPDGYPGDVPEQEPTYPALERVWRKPRTRVRYSCEHCQTTFSHSGEKKCRNCKHDRCSNCVRDPPRRPAKEHPEELLRTLEGKFDGLQLLQPGQIAGGA